MPPTRKSVYLRRRAQCCPRRLTSSLKEPTPLPAPIHLAEGSTFKLTFTIIDTESSSGVFPQQAHLLFESKDGDVTLPLTVKSGGKAGFTIVSTLLQSPSTHCLSGALLPRRPSMTSLKLTCAEHRQTTACPPLNSGRLQPHPATLVRLSVHPSSVPARVPLPADLDPASPRAQKT